jgi:hypothetical protein
MRRELILAAFSMVWFLSLPLGAAEPGEGTSLLTRQAQDGTLPGWKSYLEEPKAKIGEVWKLAEGVLICRGTPKGYLFTQKSYTNFVLTLEWRSPPHKKPGSGGVLVRMSGKHKIWPKSLEAQLNAGTEGDFWGLDGYELDGPAPRRKIIPTSPFGKLTNLQRLKNAVKKPGEWNCYEINAQEGTVTLTINGVQVNQATDCDVTAGPICLTSEGDEIHFRNVRLKEP